LPGSLVDINIDPTKSKVQFLDPDYIQDILVHGIVQALKTQLSPVIQAPVYTPTNLLHTTASRTLDLAIPKPANTVVYAPQIIPTDSHAISNTVPHIFTDSAIVTASIQQTIPQPVFAESLVKEPAQTVYTDIVPTTPKWSGQIFLTYILWEQNGIFTIADQHAWHERILFEVFYKQAQGQAVGYTELLVPVSIPVSVAEAVYVLSVLPVWETLGMGGYIENGVLYVTKWPQFLQFRLATSVVQDLIQNQESAKSSIDHWLQHVVSTWACHSAIRAGEVVTEGWFVTLWRQSQTVDFSAYCPHGRPALRHFTKQELDTWFCRIL
jgi:DNA mismatch repair protein MutL